VNPLILIAGAAALVVVLYAKGYLGFADLFGLAATAKPSLPQRPTSRDAFAKGVKLAMEEAQEEAAAKMADDMRSKVVQSYMAAFPGSGPSAQPAPDAAAPDAPVES
jgi:hypothetical protein